MSGVGLLDRIYGQGSNRVDAEGIQLLPCGQNLFTGYHAICSSRRLVVPGA
jgi:hypothetical protein